MAEMIFIFHVYALVRIFLVSGGVMICFVSENWKAIYNKKRVMYIYM